MQKEQKKNKVLKNFLFIFISVLIHFLFLISLSSFSINPHKGEKKVFTLKIKKISDKNLLAKRKKEHSSKKIHKAIKKNIYKKSTSIKSNIKKRQNPKSNKLVKKIKIPKSSISISKKKTQENKKSKTSKINSKTLKQKPLKIFKKKYVKKSKKKRDLRNINKQIKRKKKSKHNKKERVFKTQKKAAILIKKNSKSSLEAIKRKISQKIQQKQASLYPAIAIRNGIQGITKIAFKIMPDGNLQKISIRKSSGNIFLDKASLKAVSSATPFPYLKEPLNISVRWRLED